MTIAASFATAAFFQLSILAGAAHFVAGAPRPAFAPFARRGGAPRSVGPTTKVTTPLSARGGALAHLNSRGRRAVVGRVTKSSTALGEATEGKLDPDDAPDAGPDLSGSPQNGRSPRIVVLGGGFGGLNAALTMAGLPWGGDTSDDESECAAGKPTITLVDDKERFVFLPLLYELCVDAATPEEVAPTFRSLLEGTGVEFERRTVVGVDVAKKVVHTTTKISSSSSDGGAVKEERETIPYDALVVATGAQLDLGAIPGAEEFALPFYTVDQCYELRRRFNILDSMDGKAQVVIVGGGYSGVELALNTMERLGGTESCSVTLVHRGKEVLQYATDYNRQTGQQRLKEAGVKVLTETSVREIVPTSRGTAESLEVDDGSAETNGGLKECVVKVTDKRTDHQSDLPADLLLWTAGATSTNAPIGVLNSVLPRDSDGRIVTGQYLRAKGLDDVFALGDCSRARRVPYAATAQVAMQQAPVVAWNVYASLENEKNRGRRRGAGTDEEPLKLLPFSYLDLGEMMTLGNDDATISSLGGLVRLSGPGASVLRRLIYAVRMPTARQGLTAAAEGAQRRLQLSSRDGRKLQEKGQKSKSKNRGGKPIQWR